MRVGILEIGEIFRILKELWADQLRRGRDKLSRVVRLWRGYVLTLLGNIHP